MCTRCVRFTREITQTGELQVMRRGNHAEIDIFPGHPVDNPLAGNVVDLCPVGALLDKDFLHKQRVWFLSKHDAICTRCSTGCNITAEENRGQLWRFKPRYNPHVNDYWICDEGRYSYKAANDPGLLSAMYVREDGDLGPAPIDQALTAVGRGLAQVARAGGADRGRALAVPDGRGSVPAGLVPQGAEPGDRPGAGAGPGRGRGPDVHARPDQGADRRHQLRRPPAVHDPRREVPEPPGGRGGPRALPGRGDRLRGDLAAGRGGRVPGALRRLRRDRPVDRRGRGRRRSGEGSSSWSCRTRTSRPLAQLADAVLAGATFAEKAGCYVNADGRLQYSEAALPPRDGSLPDLDLFAILSGRGGGPVRSRDVLAELAGGGPGVRGRRRRASCPSSACRSGEAPEPAAAGGVRRSATPG